MVAAHVRQTMTARSRTVPMTTRGMALWGGWADDIDVILAMIARVKTGGRGWWHRSEPGQRRLTGANLTVANLSDVIGYP